MVFVNMEDHDNENVTLVLDNQRFKVNKRRLINKSQYFAVLLSKNFKDHSLSEHEINYEISLTSFEDFINWIHSDERNVIMNAIENNVQRLLTLLKLTLLFAVNELTETIIDILQNSDLTPQNALSIWPMAQEFSFNTLRDLSFSVCLDRFTELPLNLICELSKENFLHLVGHINLRIPKIMNAETYLSTVAQEWMKVNEDTIPLDILKKTERPKLYQSFVLYNRLNHKNQEFYLHCWDGDKFFEFATFKYPEELINKKIPIMEMQIIARGHNLYFIGGEFDVSPEVFNTKVWRYSLITKKWHFETTMPCERKEMIAAFVQNKLLLAGGLGPNNLQRSKSLDIYDVHKGTWTEGMDMPFKSAFIGAVDYNVVDKYLICFTCSFCEDWDSIYVYNSEMNYWFKVIKNKRNIHLHDLHMTAPIIKQFKSATCYIDRMEQNGIKLKTIVCDNPKYKQEFYKNYAKYLRIEEKYKDERNFDMYFYFIEISYKMYDYYVLFCSKNENVKGKLIHLKREHLPCRSVQNLNTYQSSFLEICSTMSSNLLNPADLYAN